MTNLTHELRAQGYDLISGPVRDQKLLQLWIKKFLSDAQLAYTNLQNVFQGSAKLQAVEAPALNVNSNLKDQYSFNLGISMLQEILHAIGLDSFDLSSVIQSGRSLSISYQDAFTQQIPIGQLQDFLSSADFRYPNQVLLREANRNDLLAVSGIMQAKKLLVSIQTNEQLSDSQAAEASKKGQGKLKCNLSGNHQLDMSYSGNAPFPIAVMANRLCFDKGHFRKTELLTDREHLF
ncbi:MAG: hypothetical protein MI784_09410 [Cytophagales bacterium]|nr:hypothetical protein [Cytophagales bacterium]